MRTESNRRQLHEKHSKTRPGDVTPFVLEGCWALDGVHQSGKGNIFLNMGGKYPNQAFTAFIPSGSAAQFTNAQQYDGKTVSVSGKIQLYKGKPEIIVNSPSQISSK